MSVTIMVWNKYMMLIDAIFANFAWNFEPYFIYWYWENMLSTMRWLKTLIHCMCCSKHISPPSNSVHSVSVGWYIVYIAVTSVISKHAKNTYTDSPQLNDGAELQLFKLYNVVKITGTQKKPYLTFFWILIFFQACYMW